MKETKQNQDKYVELVRQLSKFYVDNSINFDKVELLIYFTNIRNFHYFYGMEQGKINNKQSYFIQFNRPYSSKIVGDKIVNRSYKNIDKKTMKLVYELLNTKYGSGHNSIIYKELKSLGISVASSSKFEAKQSKLQRVMQEYLNERGRDFFYSTDIKELQEITNEERSGIYRWIKKLGFRHIIANEQKLKAKEEQQAEKVKREKWLIKNNFKRIADNIFLNENGEAWKLKSDQLTWAKIKKSLRTNNFGLQIYTLRINGVLFSAHKLVAIHFVDNPHKYKNVRAIDGNYLDVTPSNLEWVKYTASVRVMKGITQGENSWLNIILKYYKPNVKLSDLITVVATNEFLDRKYSSNTAKRNTISTIVKNYAEGKNLLFPIFKIDKDNENTVTLNKDVLAKLKNNEMV